MPNLSYPRTTLFVVDKEVWINSKAQAEHLGYTSASEYIFYLLKSDMERKISLQLLLLELEKYYEMDYYTLELVAEKTGLPLRIVVNLINELQLPMPAKKSFSHMRRVHEELTRNNLLPREIQNILSLKKEFEKKSDILSNADVLVALFPVEEERTLEVLVKTREILLRVIEVNELESNKPQNFCNLCTTYANCKFKDVRRVFYELGLDFDEETFYSDPIVKMLKEWNALPLFGRYLEYSAVELIKRELKRIDEFRLGQVLQIEVPEIKRQEKEIDKEIEKLRKELDMYFKNVVLANNESEMDESVEATVK